MEYFNLKQAKNKEQESLKDLKRRLSRERKPFIQRDSMSYLSLI